MQQHFDIFLEQALEVSRQLREEEAGSGSVILCHGDFQYHNVLFCESGVRFMNFEKCIRDNPVRDLYLFMRKLLEKGNWPIELGNLLLNAYHGEREMSEEDRVQLYYRFRYPEKFWKIVNFYYNSGKAWIPGRNLEKLERLLGQEEQKTGFLENYKSTNGWFSFSAH